MTDIMIDMTSKPIRRYVVHRCYYCDDDKYPNGKIIDPTTDKDAHKTSKGDWMCEVCTIRNLYEMNEGTVDK
jgi:hypothetical protein